MGPAMFELYSSSHPRPIRTISLSPKATPSSLGLGDLSSASSSSTDSHPLRMDTTDGKVPMGKSLSMNEAGRKSVEMSLLSAVSDAFRFSTGNPTRSQDKSPEPDNYTSSAMVKSFKLKYLGSQALDARVTAPMLPWNVADIKRRAEGSGKIGRFAVPGRQIQLEVYPLTLKAVQISSAAPVGQESESYQVVFVHTLGHIAKFCQMPNDKSLFCYLVRDPTTSTSSDITKGIISTADGREGGSNTQFMCHVFQASSPETVIEVFNTVKDLTKHISNNNQGSQSSASLGGRFGSDSGSSGTLFHYGTPLDSILSSAQQYEVLYLGRVKLFKKRTNPEFIDESVDKFRSLDSQKVTTNECENSADRDKGEDSSVGPLSGPSSSGTSTSEAYWEIKAKTMRSMSMLSDVSESGTEGAEVPDSSSPIPVPSAKAQGNSSIQVLPGPGAASNESISSSNSKVLMDKIKSDASVPSVESKSASISLRRGTIGSTSGSQTLPEYGSSPGDTENYFGGVSPPYSPYHTVTGISSIIGSRSGGGGGQSQLMADTREMVSLVRSRSGDITTRTQLKSGTGERVPSDTNITGIHEGPRRQNSLPMNPAWLHRPRTGSGGSQELKRPIRKNKTMLFLIGKFEVCLISPEKQELLLKRDFGQVSHCAQGVRHRDHFGLVCRDVTHTASEMAFVCYIFRCASDKLVEEVLYSLKQAFHSAKQNLQGTPKAGSSVAGGGLPSPRLKIVPIQPLSGSGPTLCPECPMLYFHNICVGLESRRSGEDRHAYILRKIQDLDDEAQEMIMTGTGQVTSIEEKNVALMKLLQDEVLIRQKRHKHGGVTPVEPAKPHRERVFSLANTIGNIGGKLAKNGILKYRVVEIDDELQPFERPRAQTMPSLRVKFMDDLAHTGTTDVADSDPMSPMTKTSLTLQDTTSKISSVRPGVSFSWNTAPNSVSASGRGSSVESDSGPQTAEEQKKEEEEKAKGGDQKSTLFNLFHQVTNSSSNSPVPPSAEMGPDRKGMFTQVQNMSDEAKDLVKTNQLPDEPSGHQKEDNTDQKAPPADEKCSGAKWQKLLDYEDIAGTMSADAAEGMWNELMEAGAETPLQFASLRDAVRRGIPRHRRGAIWLFLAQQNQTYLTAPVCRPGEDADLEGIDIHTPYREILQNLTSQQHLILVDLGRTFPSHPYYSQTLGAGQLSLFNLLKAYSLLDKEVGYCQGLSFVAGILLLHMEEDEAFEMVKHLLFHCGLRNQYKPKMTALQLQLYQLCRLLHDTHTDLYDHLDKWEVTPTLYAAPWFLTLFASQYPLSFVARLFDMIFLYGVEGLFRVCLALLATHKDSILRCDSFESIMEYFKSSLPAMTPLQMNLIFVHAFQLEIGKRLAVYEIEYHVIEDEVRYNRAHDIAPSSTGDKKRVLERAKSASAVILPSQHDNEATCVDHADILRKLQEAEEKNLRLIHEKDTVEERLNSSQSAANKLQSTLENCQSTIKKFELRVRTLEDEREVLIHSLNSVRRRLERQEADQRQPGQDRRAPLLTIVHEIGSIDDAPPPSMPLIDNEDLEDFERVALDELDIYDANGQQRQDSNASSGVGSI